MQFYITKDETWGYLLWTSRSQPKYYPESHEWFDDNCLDRGIKLSESLVEDMLDKENMPAFGGIVTCRITSVLNP